MSRLSRNPVVLGSYYKVVHKLVSCKVWIKFTYKYLNQCGGVIFKHHKKNPISNQYLSL